jgi:hypothetical protein
MNAARPGRPRWTSPASDASDKPDAASSFPERASSGNGAGGSETMAPIAAIRTSVCATTGPAASRFRTLSRATLRGATTAGDLGDVRDAFSLVDSVAQSRPDATPVFFDQSVPPPSPIRLLSRSGRPAGIRPSQPQCLDRTATAPRPKRVIASLPPTSAGKGRFASRRRNESRVRLACKTARTRLSWRECRRNRDQTGPVRRR